MAQPVTFVQAAVQFTVADQRTQMILDVAAGFCAFVSTTRLFFIALFVAQLGRMGVLLGVLAFHGHRFVATSTLHFNVSFAVRTFAGMTIELTQVWFGVCFAHALERLFTFSPACRYWIGAFESHVFLV
jgi:hypothetical protein